MNGKELRRSVIKQLFLICLLLIVQMTIFFISAGHIGLLRPWIFFGAAFAQYIVGTVVQYKLNPELLVQRLKIKREGSKRWDEILVRVSNLMLLIAVPVIAGLDVGRFQWSYLEVQFAVLGFVFFIVSAIFINWAMVVNPHFEQTVRIQKDRGHKVISSGPYKIVRHPGYFGGIVFAVSIPLIIGSIFALIPAGIYVILFMIRASLEDKTLHKELDGYRKYAKSVKYKLFPGIW